MSSVQDAKNESERLVTVENEKRMRWVWFACTCKRRILKIQNNTQVSESSGNKVET